MAINNRKRDRWGQSTVEYLLLVGIVIATMSVFLRTCGPFRTSYTSTLTGSANGMTDMANRMRTSTLDPDGLGL